MNDEKLTGRGGKHNFPSSPPPVDDETAKATIGSVLYWYEKGNVKKCNTPEEVQERCKEFIIECYNTGQRMTVEKLALALGVARETLWKWEQVGDERSHIIKKAKDTIAAYDADLVISGKYAPIPYIFRAKNYYGMKDTVDIIASQGNNLQDIPAEEITKKYQELPE